MGRLGGILGPSWSSWRASWAVLEAYWSHLTRLGGHLGRLGGILEAILAVLDAILSRLGGCFFWTLRSLAILSGGWRDVPEPRGEVFWKRNKTKTVIVQHARHPCDESTGGGGSNGLRPIPPPCLGYGLEASCMCVGISRYASRGPLEGSFEASLGPFGGL